MSVEVSGNQDTNKGEARVTETRSPEGDVSVAHRADAAKTAPDGKLARRRKLLLAGLALVGLVAVGIVGVPWIRLTFTTVSTDDAYVNGHVTFVAPRVAGQISRVLVDDNYRVHKGDLLAQIDKEPFEIAVAQKKAAVDTANADLQAAIPGVRGLEAEARSRRWKLKGAVEDLKNQVALLHDRVAALDKSKATLALAELNFARARQLLAPRPRAARNTTGARSSFRQPKRRLPRRWRPSAKPAHRWAYRRQPMAMKIWLTYRPILTRTIPPCSRPRPT
jgi:membrane fusion protein, multidrug efflux system